LGIGISMRRMIGPLLSAGLALAVMASGTSGYAATPAQSAAMAAKARSDATARAKAQAASRARSDAMAAKARVDAAAKAKTTVQVKANIHAETQRRAAAAAAAARLNREVVSRSDSKVNAGSQANAGPALRPGEHALHPHGPHMLHPGLHHPGLNHHAAHMLHHPGPPHADTARGRPAAHGK
jgi:hypothetical protein